MHAIDCDQCLRSRGIGRGIWAGGDAANSKTQGDGMAQAVQKGAKWLVSVQGNDGGWGQDGGETSYVRQGERLESNGTMSPIRPWRHCAAARGKAISAGGESGARVHPAQRREKPAGRARGHQAQRHPDPA